MDFVVEVLADEEVLDAGSVGYGCEILEVEMAEVKGEGHKGKKVTQVREVNCVVVKCRYGCEAEG